MDEGELVRLACQGNKDALETLLYDNYKIIYGYVLKLTMNEELSKDLTQETMVKAIMNITRFEGKSKISTWLITIATNIYKDSLRKRKRISNVEIEKISLISPDNVEEIVETKDSMLNLKKALTELPENKRMVFVLKYYHNYSYEEIAKTLKCPIGTVRSRLHYCLEKLHKTFE